MPFIFPSDKRQNYLFKQTIKYALHVNVRYVTDLHISPHVSMPCTIMTDMPHIIIYLGLLYMPFLIPSDKRQNTYLYPQLSMPCIFMEDT